MSKDQVIVNRRATLHNLEGGRSIIFEVHQQGQRLRNTGTILNRSLGCGGGRADRFREHREQVLWIDLHDAIGQCRGSSKEKQGQQGDPQHCTVTVRKGEKRTHTARSLSR